MSNVIKTEYDHEIRAFVVSFPEHITMILLSNWQIQFQKMMDAKPQTKAILLDTNKHDFESIECLKLLRNVISRAVNDNRIQRIAFVQPKQFMQPGIVNENEAYF